MYYVLLMAEFAIQALICLVVFLVWLLAVSLVVRASGVPLPLRWPGILSTRTFSQHVLIVGVLYWGCGMFLMMTLWHYLDWKYWGGSSRDLSTGRVLFGAVWWPLSGLLFGWMAWNRK